MANPDHVKVVRSGTDAIRRWRRRNEAAWLDLSSAELPGVHLANANLVRANFAGANLGGANLAGSNLARANLARVNLVGADLTKAKLIKARLTMADLESANLAQAALAGAKFNSASLDGANLTGAAVFGATLTDVSLERTAFRGVQCGSTVFADTDLSGATDLDTVQHDGPSAIDVDTLSKSKGRIPDAFLRGCGLSDWEVLAAKLYAPDLGRDGIDRILYDISAIRSGSAIQISPLFISYSHVDAAFVDHLEGELNARRIRFWRDVHDLKAGRVERQLERGISMNPTVLLVLSKDSTNSDWVEWEASKGRDLEKKLGRDALCPVALDDAWKTCSWSGPLRRQIEDYHILDFSRWVDPEIFTRQFGKLIEGLGLFYYREP